MPVEEDVGTLLKHQRKTIAVAEACTAGMVGFLLTSIPGSSSYFHGGVLCYARSVKVNVLGVHAETLAAHGSVHRLTALEMALRVRELCEAEIGIATTGVAGPGGGTSERPVGLFYVAISTREGHEECWEQLFDYGSRNANREATARLSLELLKNYLQGCPP
jgi:PncC family amidohydrolase